MCFKSFLEQSMGYIAKHISYSCEYVYGFRVKLPGFNNQLCYFSLCDLAQVCVCFLICKMDKLPHSVEARVQ